MEMAVNGGVISYDVAGTGTPLVLLHGGEASKKMWYRVVPLLSDAFTVITYDQRDSGDTTFPAGSYEISDHADDAAALISGLGHDRAHVLGTSYGGVVAQEIALRHPDRVDRLVLAVTGRGLPETAGGSLSEEAREVVRNAAAATPRRDHYPAFFSPTALERDPGLIDDFRRISSLRSDDASAGRMARRMAALKNFSSSGRLSRITAHTLVLSGFHDRMVPAEEPWAIAREIPHATLAVLSDMGHVWALEVDAAQRATALISAFLREKV